MAGTRPVEPTDHSIFQSASILFAAILTSRPSLTPEETVLARWAAIDTAKRMLKEIVDRDRWDVGDYILHHQGEGSILKLFERQALDAALLLTAGNRCHAARVLGLTRTTFLYHLQKHLQQQEGHDGQANQNPRQRNHQAAGESQSLL